VNRRMTSDQRLLETSFSFMYKNNPPLQRSDVNTKQLHIGLCEIAFRLKAFIVQEKATVAAALFIIVPSSV